MKHTGFAFLNFILPGSAYLFLKERVLFGSLILVSEILLWTAPFPEAVEESLSTSFENFQFSEWWLVLIAYLAYSAAFAFDAYRISRSK